MNAVNHHPPQQTIFTANTSQAVVYNSHDAPKTAHNLTADQIKITIKTHYTAACENVNQYNEYIYSNGHRLDYSLIKQQFLSLLDLIESIDQTIVDNSSEYINTQNNFTSFEVPLMKANLSISALNMGIPLKNLNKLTAKEFKPSVFENMLVTQLDTLQQNHKIHLNAGTSEKIQTEYDALTTRYNLCNLNTYYQEIKNPSKQTKRPNFIYIKH